MIINIADLKSEKLRDLFPEFYELKNCIENSADYWHQQESVYNHTLSVMLALEKIFSENNNLETLFNQKISSYTRKDLLEVATLFHDIGKKETMIKEGEFTKCAGHEAVGTDKTKRILERFNLSEREKEIILEIIANHSVFHKLLMPDNKNFEKDLDDLREKFGRSIYPELILLSYADTINSKLSSANQKEFRQGIDFYKNETKKIK